MTPYHYKKRIDTLKIIGSWNNFDFETSEMMQRVNDHQFQYSRIAESDTLAYQIVGLVSSARSINGQQSDAYTYDGGGDFESVLYVKKGQRVTITIDTRNLQGSREPAPPSFVADEAHHYLATLNQFNHTVQVELNKFYTAVGEYRKQHQGNMDGFSYSLPPQILKFLQKQLNQTILPIQEIGAIATLVLARATGSVPAALIQKALHILSPTSRGWAINPYTLYYLGSPKDSIQFPYQLDTIYRQNPAEKVKAIALQIMMQLARKNQDESQFLKYYNTLKQQYGHYKRFERILQRFNPDPPIQKGKKLVDFSVPSLDGTQTYRISQFKGKYVLLDFWAVWCGPCRSEMPYLHQAYQTYKNREFVILSLSFDQSPAAVEKFRQKKWPMPWYHAFVAQGFNSNIARKLNIQAIPHPILIGPDGTILAQGDQLRGKQLLQTLAQIFP